MEEGDPTANAISVRLTDGLGNQLFQYALGRSLSHRLGVRLFLDAGWYETRAAQPRPLSLPQYRLRGEYLPSHAFSHFWLRPTLAGRVWWRVEQKIVPLHHRRFIEQSPHEFRLKRRAFDARIMRVRPGTYLSGWWISHRYFSEIEGMLREELVHEPAGPRAARTMAEMSDCESVAIHIRRGDYRNHPEIGCLGPDYYHRAVAALSERISSPRYFVFSDEPEVAREVLRGIIEDFSVVDLDAGATPASTLSVMAACRHFVIANSTFGWWGAWLARHSAKVVVAPRHWYAGARVEVQDVYPEAWVQVEG